MMTTTNPPLSQQQQRLQVESFLSKEARLLDQHDYESWLALWTNDARYWVPSNRNDVDPRREVSIIYDDRDTLEDRAFRMSHPASFAHHPPPRLARVVSNVEFEATREETIEVLSTYVLVVNRRGEQEVFGARVEHTLVREGDDLRIKTKKVALTANDEAFSNLTFLP